MKRLFVLLLVCLPLLVIAQTDSLNGGVYNWKEPLTKNTSNASTILFEGSTHTMKWIQVSSVLLSHANAKATMRIPKNEECLIIVRSGTLKLTLKDSTFIIGAGSIALLPPGEMASLRSTEKLGSYYTFNYRSHQPANLEKATTDYTIVNWDTVVFKPGEKGGRRNFMERSTTMCKRIEIHATTLKQGLQSHALHRHTAAEFTLIKEGQTQMQIGNSTYKGVKGSIFYAPSNVLHALQNTGTGNCTYFAIQFE